MRAPRLKSLLLALFAAGGAVPLPAATFYAVTSTMRLVKFESALPGVITSDMPVTGLPTGEKLAGIDFRPSNGVLYGVSTGSRVYTINTSSGVATPLGATTLTPALSGALFGVDFNPVADRIRLVSDTGQNLRLQPDTGVVSATDTPLAYAASDVNAAAAPKVAEVGYTNSFSGATTTTLYGIDYALGTLVRQGSMDGTPVSPNSGQLTTVGKLGPTITSSVGFDISRFGTAFASMQTGPAGSALYTVDLNSGAATMIGNIGFGLIVTGLAILENTGPAPNCSLTGTPVVSAVFNAANYQLTASPNALLSVFFTGVSGISPAQATSADFFNQRFPNELGCVAVEFSGVRAPVTYTGPGQVNVQLPVNTAAGLAMTRIVLNPGRPNEIRGSVVSGPMVQQYTPALFTFNNSTVAAQSANFSLIADPTVVPGGRFAHPGEVVILYGTGFGISEPVYQSGELAADKAITRDPVSVTIGATAVPAADVFYAGLTPGSISGLYQINVRVPANTGSGNVPVTVRIGGLSSQDGVTLPVQP